MDLSIYALNQREGRAFWFLNTLTFIKAETSQTGGGFALIEQIAPVGSGSPYHVHHREDESFYVLEGELEFISGERRMKRGPGTFVFLPREIPHGFRVVEGSPARYLVLTTPSGFEQFVIEAGTPAQSLTLPTPSAPDMEKLVAAATRHQIDILGPLPD